MFMCMCLAKPFKVRFFFFFFFFFPNIDVTKVLNFFIRKSEKVLIYSNFFCLNNNEK
jgi:hypothetical protein